MGAGKVQESTIDTWLNGLRLWHDCQSARWYGADILRRTKKGAAALAPASGVRPQRLPVTHKHMLALRKHLDYGSVWAVATLTWCSCSRLGEFLLSAGKQFDPKFHIHAACPRHFGISSNGHRWLNLFVPFTKTRRYKGDWISVTASNDEINAVSALENHLSINTPVPDSPLFWYKDSDGRRMRLDKDIFMTRCNGIWALEELEAALGHSFRIGGTTHLLLLGVEPWIVMKQGRWSSKAFLLYWRKVEEILPLFIGDSMDKMSSIKASLARLSVF
ncbi:hypothetical protein BDZ89DRAFT_1242709 [Hymenopellis radicata]|nr:hypothetical protein BDZ89DRAFT_1242709 [Hymenopellis radicata]